MLKIMPFLISLITTERMSDNKTEQLPDCSCGKNRYSHYSDIAEGNALNDAEREARSLLYRRI